MGCPVCLHTLLDRKFTGTASTASSAWVKFPTDRPKNPASRAQILSNPASRVAVKSRIPSRYLFSVFPNPAPYFGQIPDPKNTLPDPVTFGSLHCLFWQKRLIYLIYCGQISVHVSWKTTAPRNFFTGCRYLKRRNSKTHELKHVEVYMHIVSHSCSSTFGNHLHVLSSVLLFLLYIYICMWN